MDLSEPEVTVEDDNVSVHVTGTVRIVITSECCGDELKEANFDVDEIIEAERAENCTCDLSEVALVDPSAEITERSDAFTAKIAKRGPNKGKEVKRAIPYRYRKNYYGAAMALEITCPCGKTSERSDWAEEVQSSGMDEMT